MNVNHQILVSILIVSLSFLTGCNPSKDSVVIEDPIVVEVPVSELNVEFIETPEEISTLAYAKFEFSAPSASGYQCQLDNEFFTDCSSPQFLFQISAGQHQFWVRALDLSGVIGEETPFAWTVESVLTNQSDDLIPTNVAPSSVADNSWRGIIRINCDFAHSSYNDPIVFPGAENAAHLHRFYGNTLVDHQTTVESLLTSGESSCQGNLLNLSSYWLPALLAPEFDEVGQRLLNDLGEPAWQVVPAVVGNDEEAHEIFYYSAGIDDLDAIQPAPVGLRMIAGDHMGNIAQQQDTSIVRWHCQEWEADDSENPTFSTSIPECFAPDRVRLDIFFPSCWNGTDLDSNDHKSHMAYPINAGGPSGAHCPDSHSVPIVRPSYHYAFGVKPEVYDPQSHSSRGWRLAADMYIVDDENPGGMSLHGDWFNGWHPEVMQMLLDNCIKQALDCHDGNLANGFRLSGTRAGSQIEPEIINRGLGY